MVIDADGLDRAFHIFLGVSVDIEDMTIMNGDPAGRAGGIFNRGTTELTRVDLLLNTASGDGGAIKNGLGGVLTLVECWLWANTADDGGGRLLGRGPGARRHGLR